MSPVSETPPARLSISQAAEFEWHDARILAELPDLTAGLWEDDLARARSVVASAFSAAHGPLPVPSLSDPRATMGLMILEGAVARSLSVVGRAPSVGLLGQGDVSRPLAD